MLGACFAHSVEHEGEGDKTEDSFAHSWGGDYRNPGEGGGGLD